MGSLFAVNVLPTVLFGSFAGVLIDRFNRKKLLIAIDLIRALLVACVPLLYAFDLLAVWVLYVIAVPLSILTMAYDVAVVALVPNIAGTRLTQANASIQTITQIADMAGPVVAGLLMAALGPYHLLWLDVVSFGAIVFTLTGLPPLPPAVKKPGNQSVMKEMKEGFLWLIHSPVNITLSLQAAIGNFGYSAVYAVLPFYMLSSMHLDANQVGVNYSLLGAGGVIGSVGVVFLDKRFERRRVIPCLLVVGMIGFLVAAFCPAWFAPGLGFALVGACNVAWSIIASSIRQETIPAPLLGRVLSFSRVLTRAAMPLGAMLGGLITDTLNPLAVFLVAAAAKGIEVVIASRSPIQSLKRGERDALHIQA